MRPVHTFTGPLAAALTLATLAAPATAAARSGSDQRSAVAPAVRVDQELRSPDARDAAAGRSSHDATAPAVPQNLSSPDARDAAAPRSPAGRAAPVVEITRADGFDWGDAAIGAAGAMGLLAIALAGAMTLRRHTRPRSRIAVG